VRGISHFCKDADFQSSAFLVGESDRSSMHVHRVYRSNTLVFSSGDRHFSEYIVAALRETNEKSGYSSSKSKFLGELGPPTSSSGLEGSWPT